MAEAEAGRNQTSVAELRLSALPDGRQVMFKLSIPTEDDFYAALSEDLRRSRAGRPTDPR
jgi:hypothetical protein